MHFFTCVQDFYTVLQFYWISLAVTIFQVRTHLEHNRSILVNLKRQEGENSFYDSISIWLKDDSLTSTVTINYYTLTVRNQFKQSSHHFRESCI